MRIILSMINLFVVTASICVDEISVNVTDMIMGLKTNTPQEVIDAYIEATGKCIGINKMRQISTLNTGNSICNEQSSCGWCGTIAETKENCKTCCNKCRCVGCSWNRGPGINWYGHERMCDSCCVDPGEEKCDSYMSECYGCQLSNEGSKSCKPCCNQCRCKGCTANYPRYGWLKEVYGDYVCDECCDDSRRRLENEDIEIYFNMNTCIDKQYRNYEDMLENLNNELHYCYQNRSQFMNTWASLTSERGIDLSLMVRDDMDNDFSTILFGHTGMEIESAQVISYGSSESHKSTSYMLFYGAIGFIIVSISAVLSTAIVIKVVNKRKEQKARLLSEMNNNIV